MKPNTEPDPVPMIASYLGEYGPQARFRQKKMPQEAKTYDFRAARTNVNHHNTVLASSFHMMMVTMGSGLVAVHAAYMECGLWISLLINIILCSSVGYCVCILVWSAQKMYGRVQQPQLSYPDLAEACLLLCPWSWLRKCARAFRYLVEFTICIHCYGSCCVFLIMIARNLKELVEGTETISDEGDPPLKVYILSLMVPCAIVCMFTNLKNLAPFALIANIYAVAITLTTMWYALHNVTGSPFDRPAYKCVDGVFALIGITIFISETASIALPLENHMDQPKKFHYVILITMPIVTVMMMFIGFFGYWHYGEQSVTPITIHFPFRPFPIQLKVFLNLVLYVIYAMCFYSAFDIEWFYIQRLHQQANYWFWERLYRILHVVAITLLGFAVPNIIRWMAVIGSCCTSPFVFLYPPFIEVIVDWEYPGLGRFKWRLLKFVALTLFALAVTSVGTFYNIYSFLEEMDGMEDTLIQKRN